MNKKIIVLIVISILLTSCGGVTPVPPTVKPTPTPTTTTPRIAVRASSTPTTTLQPVANDYQLQPWIVDDPISKLIDEHGVGFYWDINSLQYRYDAVFKSVNLLKDPSLDWREVSWEIVAGYPKGVALPGMRPNEDLMAFLLEDLLNTKNVKPDELIETVNNKLPIPWGCFRAQIIDSPLKRGDYLYVKNLFGEKEDGWVFFVGNCQAVAVYVLRSIGHIYQVEKLREWQALEIPAAGFELLLDVVGDVNNNSIPEIVIDELFGASGTPPGRGETIEFYEWSAATNTFETDSIRMSENVCYVYAPCENGWRVEGVNAQGYRPIAINEQYATMYDNSIDEIPSCDNYIIEHLYLWKNGRFVEQKKSYLPPTDERVECQLSWALQSLKRSGDQGEIVEKIISSSLVDWPPAMNEVWGPASKDYFALQLGLYYDFSGKEDTALNLIRKVAENPFNPDFQFIPGLASSYLATRSKYGKMRACREINLLQEESEYKELPLYAIYVPIGQLRKIWGVGTSLWTNRIDDVCNEKTAFEVLAQQAQSSLLTIPSDWLLAVGTEPLDVKTVYESGSLKVWLLSLPVQSFHLSLDGKSLDRSDNQQIWLISESAKKFKATYIGDIGLADKFWADYLKIDQDDLLVAIQTGDSNFSDFYILRITPNGDVVSQLSDYLVDGFVDHDGQKITTIFEAYGASQPDITEYKWNSASDTLDKSTVNFDFSGAQDDVERLVFQNRDFSHAILYINKFLVQAPPEPKIERSCIYGNCEYYPEWYRPYMRYLLALSYEMSDQIDQARDAYFDLWQDYPTNVFGLAAEHRLEPMLP